MFRPLFDRSSGHCVAPRRSQPLPAAPPTPSIAAVCKSAPIMRCHAPPSSSPALKQGCFCGPCVRCGWSLAPVLGAIVASVRSSIPCCVACSALRSCRRARSRDARCRIGELDDGRVRPSCRTMSMAARMGGFYVWGDMVMPYVY